MSVTRILYIGKDDVFCKQFVDEMHSVYDDLSFVFEKQFFKKNEEVNKARQFITSYSPHVILADFSYVPKTISRIAWDIRTSLDTKDVIVVALLNAVNVSQIENANLSAQKKKGMAEKIKENNSKSIRYALLTQAHLIHFKGIDLKNIILDSMWMSCENKSAQVKYATKKGFELEVDSFVCSKLTHLTEESVILENSISIPENYKLKLRSGYYKLLNELTFEYESSMTELMKTGQEFRYKLRMLFSDGEDKTRLVDKSIYKNWFISNNKFSEIKHTKLLIVQRKLNVLDQLKKPLQDYSFIIKYQTKFDDQLRVVKNYRPSIIAVEFDSIDDHEEMEDDNCIDVLQDEEIKNIGHNNIESLKILVNEVKKIESYEPIVVIFNNLSSGRAFKKAFDYKYLMSTPQKIDFSYIEKMVDLYEESKRAVVEKSSDEFISSDGPPIPVHALELNSHISIYNKVILTSISEHEVTFYSSNQLSVHSLVRFTFPVSFLVTVVSPFVELEKKKGHFHYTGVINGVDEIGLRKIRKYVNELIFSDHMEKKRKELSDFKKRNLDYQNEKDNSESDAVEDE